LRIERGNTVGNARDPKASKFSGHQGLLKNGTNSGGVVVKRWYDVVVFQCVFKTVSFCLVLYSIERFITAASILTKRYPFVPHPNLLPEGEGIVAGAETASAGPIKIKVRRKIKFGIGEIQTRYCVKVVSC
jgi:hypothetical protein